MSDDTTEIYTLDEEMDSVSDSLCFPDTDQMGTRLDIARTDKFARTTLDVADEVMYMGEEDFAEFVAGIDDPALLRAIAVNVKGAQIATQMDLDAVSPDDPEDDTSPGEGYITSANTQYSVAEALEHLQKQTVQLE